MAYKSTRRSEKDLPSHYLANQLFVSRDHLHPVELDPDHGGKQARGVAT